jgi:cytochrome bd ubiquinol oxidase subunit II
MAQALLVVLFAALTAYVLLGGADFGGGFWDLVAGGGPVAMRRRRLIEHALGPVWEANHVWLIFAVVMLWGGFPSVFAAVSSTAYIPLTIVALGIIGRGAGFAFRKVSVEYRLRRLFGATFAFSSVATPFFLGAVAGGIASGRIPPGVARGHLVASWWNPTSVATGVLAVGVGAYLAAVFLTREALWHDPDLVPALRRSALLAGGVVGILAAAGLLVVRLDAPGLFDSLFGGSAWVFVLVSIVAGVASLVLLWARRFVAVRPAAGLAVASILWGWGAAQYPNLLPGTTVDAAAANPAVVQAVLAVSAVGALLIVPSLWWLFSIFDADRRGA